MGFTRVIFLWSCHPTDETRGLTLESKSHAVQNMTFTNLKDSLQGVLPPKTNVGGSNSRSKSMVFFEGFPRFDSAWSLGYWCHRPEKRMVGRLRFLSFLKLVPFFRGQTSSFSCRLPDMKILHEQLISNTQQSECGGSTTCKIFHAQNSSPLSITLWKTLKK